MSEKEQAMNTEKLDVNPRGDYGEEQEECELGTTDDVDVTFPNRIRNLKVHCAHLRTLANSQRRAGQATPIE
ncbi:unnamed protein product [Haemonchus placei]|uniref:Uncharacterized protein n=1 Tax=Haemonchus placei TaxID=6290 RepID=A0A0N4W0H8_HAEPC|nr:unnamed protein product [Haemonchus placei]